jgi:phage-related protein
MAYEVEYFNAKVLEQIEAWPVDLLADYARLTELLSEHGPELGMPHSKAMGKGLFELRPRAKSLAGRAFYCFRINRRIVVLHSFIKKTPQTPKEDLAIARKRLKELENART